MRLLIKSGLLALLLIASQAIAKTEAPACGSFADAVSKAAPAVVSIHTTKQMTLEAHPLFKDPFFRHFFGDQDLKVFQEQQPGLGSGVIIDSRGTILTNNHVIQDASEIIVRLADGREAKAKVIGADTDSDLAVLRVDLKNLPVISLGDSDKIRVGDVVLAIGNPFGMGQTITQGIVSATKRNGVGVNAFENFIQTDASINPGNSGGALIDANGNLIGINTAIFSRTGGSLGIGFAIPTSLAKDVMTQLVDQGHVIRGWLGVTVRQITPELRDSLSFPKGEGSVVDGVMRDGPAHKAGLLPGDVITSVNNAPTPTPVDLRRVTADLSPDKSYPMVVVREGQSYDFKVTIKNRPTPRASEK
jgi:Do/DeqQ family serine protease